MLIYRLLQLETRQETVEMEGVKYIDAMFIE